MALQSVRGSDGSLRGARIWLSASIPTEMEADDEIRKSIASFVATFAQRVFERGGHIVHGSHPSIVPILADVSTRFVSSGRRRDILLLATSRYFDEGERSFLLPFAGSALVEETLAATGEGARERSLQILREWMSSRADAFVAVGGRGWKEGRTHPGVPEELRLALDRYLPCFILGGLGGALREYLDAHPDLIHALRNGLGYEKNRDLALTGNVSHLAREVVDQLERLPLVRGSGEAGSTFRILALDGGGIKGAFTAAVLAKWEQQTGLKVVEHFDLIAGTSTGGILALGLAAGLSPADMLRFYKDRGPKIFPMITLGQRVRRKLRQIFHAKFGSKELESALREVLDGPAGRRHLRDAICRLVIPTFHAVDGVPHVFRTPHQVGVRGDADVDFVQVALATSAAPTYLPAAAVHSAISKTLYFDGGVWANAPVLAALVEAVSVLHVPLERLDILTVGTTDEIAFFGDNRKTGFVGWARSLVNLFMNAQQEASLQLTKRLVGEERFMRVNSPAATGRYKLDDPRQTEELAAKGERIAAEVLPAIQTRFLNGVKVAPFTPARNAPEAMMPRSSDGELESS
jgi:patatin-like phospholipase/acyl hydrolase